MTDGYIVHLEDNIHLPQTLKVLFGGQLNSFLRLINI